MFAALVMVVRVWSQCTLSVDFEHKRVVDGITSFEPKKFRNFHSKPFGIQMTDEELRYLVKDLSMNMGRATNSAYERGSPSFRSNPTEGEMSVEGRKHIERMKKFSAVQDYVNETELILVDSSHLMQELDGIEDYRRFGRYAAKYVRNFFAPDEGIQCPMALEGVNEPMVKAKVWHPEDPTKIYNKVIDFHREYCTIIREEFNENDSCRPLCGGWAAGWVQFQYNDFDVYRNRLSPFISGTCGAIDFISLHAYDSQKLNRGRERISGSGLEALKDLIATETRAICGKELPLLVSEYSIGSNDLWYRVEDGSGEKFAAEYCPSRDFAIMNSVSTMFVQFMARPSAIVTAIPFFQGKSHDSRGNPLPWTLMRTVNGTTTFTHSIKFYEMIRDLEGDFVHVSFDCPTILAHALVHEKHGFLIIKNSAEEKIRVDLSYLNGLPPVESIEYRSLWLDDTEWACAKEQQVRSGEPQLTTKVLSSLTELNMKPEEFAVIKFHFKQAPNVMRLVDVTSHFSTKFMVPIFANQTMSFPFEDVPTGRGLAYIRLSLGRRSWLPFRACRVAVNDVPIVTGEKWVGANLTESTYQWASLEYTFDRNLLTRKSTIEVVCSLSGGSVSSVSLRVDNLKSFVGEMKSDAITFTGNLLKNGGFEDLERHWAFHRNVHLSKWQPHEGRLSLQFRGQGRAEQFVTVEPGVFELSGRGKINRHGQRLQLAVDGVSAQRKDTPVATWHRKGDWSRQCVLFQVHRPTTIRIIARSRYTDARDVTINGYIDKIILRPVDTNRSFLLFGPSKVSSLPTHGNFSIPLEVNALAPRQVTCILWDYDTRQWKAQASTSVVKRRSSVTVTIPMQPTIDATHYHEVRCIVLPFDSSYKDAEARINTIIAPMA